MVCIFSGIFSDGGNFDGIANFTKLAIWHNAATVSVGDLVSTSDFLALSNVSDWITSDGSSYDWFDKASFSVSSTSVPEPSALVLLGLGVAGIGFSRRKSKN